MNKTELAEKLAATCDLTQAKANEVLAALFDTDAGRGIIAVELDAGREVQITGFGAFAAKRRAARKGRNPATGEQIDIPAKIYPTFRPGKGLKDRVGR